MNKCEPIEVRIGPPAMSATRRLLLASLAGCLALSVPSPLAVVFSTTGWADDSDGGEGGESGGGDGSDGGEGGNSGSGSGDSGSDGGEGGDSGSSDGGDGGSDDDGGSDSGEGGNSGPGGDDGSDGGEDGESGSDGGNSGPSGGSDGGEDGNSGKSGDRGRSGGDDDGDVNENGTDDDAEQALELRESGKIRPLGQVYASAERRFQARVIGSKLVETPGQGSGWRYDLSVVTGGGQVQQVSYDAGSGTLVAIDGTPPE